MKHRHPRRHAWWSLIHIGKEFRAALCSPELREAPIREASWSCQLLGRLGQLFWLPRAASRIHSLTLGCDTFRDPQVCWVLFSKTITLTRNQAPGKGITTSYSNSFTGRTCEPLSPSWSFLREDSEARGPWAFHRQVLFSFSSFESEFGAHDRPESHPILAGQDLRAFRSRRRSVDGRFFFMWIGSLAAWKKLTPRLAASPTRKT